MFQFAICLLFLFLTPIHSETASEMTFHSFSKSYPDIILEDHLENEFSYEIDNQEDDLYPSLGFCEICHSPMTIIETEKGVELQCDCD